MYLFGMFFLFLALGFSLFSKSEEEKQTQEAYLSFNGYYEAIKSHVLEVGLGSACDFKKGHPDLKGDRTTCFLVSYLVEKECYFLEPAESPVWLTRDSHTFRVSLPEPLINGDTIWTVVGEKSIKTNFNYCEVE